MVKEKPNLHVAHSGMGSGDGVDPETTGGDDGGGNDALYTAQEIIDAFPKGHLHRVTAWWVFVAVCMALIDGALMVHATQSRFADALGNSTVADVVIYFAAALTLAIFLAISFLWKKGGEK